uniref:Uncharacterized protein n=1 Tax=Oryza rufipogon TaxID=4529 RepID=A0A0E0QU13_ORYRU
MPKPWGPPPVSSLHRDGEAAKSKLKQADDPPSPSPPPNTDDDHWHRDSGNWRYKRRSREDEAAPPPLGEDLLLAVMAYALQLPQSFLDVQQNAQVLEISRNPGFFTFWSF